jgi:Tfp pilus assembly protein PilN
LIEINLLPAGEKKRRPASRPGAARRRLPEVPKLGGDPYMAGLGGLALLLFLGLGFMYWRTGSAQTELEARLERAVEDSTRLTSTIQLVETLEARQDTIESKIGVIRSVDERRYVWPHLMDEVARAIPPYTWLTRLAAAEDDASAAPADTTAARAAGAPGGPKFSIEGNTGSTQALTRFMKSLEASPFIRDVTLVTSEQTSTAGRSYQKFTLEARFEVPDSSFIETLPVVPVR